MDKKTNILIAIIILLLATTIYLFINAGTEPENNFMMDNNESVVVETNDDFMKPHIPATLTDGQKAQLKVGSDAHEPSELTFDITGGSFYYTPNEIKVKQGDKVKIIFTNAGGTHDLILEAFDVRTKTIQTGETDTIEFMADKKGTFEFYCGVGNGYHRMMGQIGVLIVE